jgi:ABC-2 type transport system ATP-binding protein
LLEPTYGRVRLDGVDLLDEPLRVLPRIGFMPDFPPLYEDLTVFEFLDLFASAYGLRGPERRARVESLLAKVQLTDKAGADTGGLSRGMKQRLFLAKTLLHDPDLLLLDEPASGLDPRARLDLRDVIVELGREGKAVLVSSHILAEMADFCNSVGIMEQGKMIVSGRIEDIQQRLQPGLSLSVRLAAPDERLGPLLRALPGVGALTVEADRATLRLPGGPEEAAALLRALVQAGLPVADFHDMGGNLQDIFLRVSTGRVS